MRFAICFAFAVMAMRVFLRMAIKLHAATAAAERHSPEQPIEEADGTLAARAAHIGGAAFWARQGLGVWLTLLGHKPLPLGA
jgi:hypothetical protein